MSARMYANSPDEWAIIVECPLSNCGADVAVTLTGAATYAIPTHCTECERPFTVEQRTGIMEAAERAWDNYEPTESELQGLLTDGGSGDDTYRRDLINAGRGHLLT